MKKIWIFSALLLLAPLSLAGCKRSSSNDGPETPSGSGEEDDDSVTVNFYLDYNKINLNEVYHSQTVKRGKTVSEPPKPSEAPSPEFPVFLGWSAKEIIDDKKDLWNFSKDKITTEYDEFEIFGIWVAEGEN